MKKRWSWIKENRQFHIGRGILRILLFALCIMAGAAFLQEFYRGIKEREKSGDHRIQEWMEHAAMDVWMPGLAVFQDGREVSAFDPESRLILENFPVLLYSMEQPGESVRENARESDYLELLRLEGSDEDNKDIDEGSLEYDEDAIHLDQGLEKAFLAENGLLTENQAAGGEEMLPEEETPMQEQEFVFHEVEEPLYHYQWEELQEYEDLKKAFYAVDSSTTAGAALLNIQKLLSEDMRMKGSSDKPQILIYHTHSRESFSDSVPGDESTSIVGAGEKLAGLLRDKYGYNVIHHTTAYDKEARDDAYNNALPELEKLLADNPTIEVVIDLHRDEMPADRRLVVDLQGRPTAQFMFFNGLSRTAKNGAITYLENPNLDSNLAFSFQMQTAANEYYPGITRRIYLKAYRYNMHLRPKSLLIELGAQNNTVEEIMNAVDPLAHIIHLVLSGDEPDRD